MTKKILKMITYTLLLLVLAGCGSDRCDTQQGIIDEYSIIEYEEERYEESDSLCESHNQEPEYLHQLVRAGEFVTPIEMEALKVAAFRYQSIYAGMGSFANIIAIEVAEGYAQQVFIGFGGFNTEADNFEDWKFETDIYERLQINTSDEVQAFIVDVTMGGGSGELVLAYKFVRDEYEWIEVFGNYIADIELLEFVNITSDFMVGTTQDRREFWSFGRE